MNDNDNFVDKDDKKDENNLKTIFNKILIQIQ